jgi:hypothetical protein
MSEIDPTGRWIILIFVGFIIAINISLILAFRDRNRSNTSGPSRVDRSIFKSREEDATRELARRVAALQEQQKREAADEAEAHKPER